MTPPLQIVTGTRTERYTARLDRHLVKLPNDRSRVAFLSDQYDQWMAAYDNFCKLMASPRYKHPANGASANDYVLTIGEISSRLGKYRHRIAASALPAGNGVRQPPTPVHRVRDGGLSHGEMDRAAADEPANPARGMRVAPPNSAARVLPAKAGAGLASPATVLSGERT